MLTLLAIIGLVVLVIAAIVLTETEKFGFATLTLIGSLVLAQLTHVADVLHYVEHHAVQVGIWAAGYVVAGVAWSFAKWFSYLMSFRDKFRETKEEFLKLKELPLTGNIPDDQREAFQKYLRENYRYTYGEHYNNIVNLERPRATKNKTRILSWMTLWPFSFVGTVLNDPVRRLFNFLFNYFKALYQKLADRVLAKDVELK